MLALLRRYAPKSLRSCLVGAPKSLRACLAAVAAAIAAAGCVPGGPGPAVPETARQKLAVAEAQFTAAVRTAIDLYRAGVLTDEQARRLHPLFVRGRAALDAAEAALRAGQPQDTLGYLRVTNNLLLEIRKILREAQEEGRTSWQPAAYSKLWT